MWVGFHLYPAAVHLSQENNQYTHWQRKNTLLHDSPGRQELDGRVVADGVHENSPVVVLGKFVVVFPRILEPDFHGRVRLAAVSVNDLAEADVSPGKTVWVVERRNGADLAGLFRIESPRQRGTGPAFALDLLVQHDAATDDAVDAEQGEIGVVVDASKGRHVVQNAIFPTQIADLVLGRKK